MSVSSKHQLCMTSTSCKDRPAEGPVWGSHKRRESVFAAPTRAAHILENLEYPTRIPRSSSQHEDSINFVAIEGDDERDSISAQPLTLRRMISLSSAPDDSSPSWDSMASGLSRTQRRRQSAPCLATASANGCLGLMIDKISQPISKVYSVEKRNRRQNKEMIKMREQNKKKNCF